MQQKEKNTPTTTFPQHVQTEVHLIQPCFYLFSYYFPMKCSKEVYLYATLAVAFVSLAA